MIKRLKATAGLTVVAYGDCHGIYHSPGAVNILIQMIESIQPDVIVNLGDHVDSESISNFRKPVEALLTLQDDIDAGIKIHKAINNVSPNSDKYLCIGNHTQRINKILQDVPGLSSLEALKVEELFKLNDLNITFVDSLLVGKGQHQAVEFTHGFLARKNPGASVREMALQRGLQTSLVIGHTHKLSLENRTTSTGSITLVEAGWMGSVERMSYMRGKTANWKNAVVVITWRGKPLAPVFEIVPININSRAMAYYRDQEFKEER